MNKDPFEKQLEDAKSERTDNSINNRDDEYKYHDKPPTENKSNQVQDETSESSTFGNIELSEPSTEVDSEFPFVKMSLSSIAIYFLHATIYDQPIFPIQWLFALVVVLGLINVYLESQTSGT